MDLSRKLAAARAAGHFAEKLDCDSDRRFKGSNFGERLNCSADRRSKSGSFRIAAELEHEPPIQKRQFGTESELQREPRKRPFGMSLLSDRNQRFQTS